MKHPAPPLTPRSGDYWRSGADGKLRIQQCKDCGLYMHPPQTVCRRCYKTDLAFAPVSGKGTVYAFTINRYKWHPDMDPPYVIADIELVEQAGLRLQSMIVGVAPEAVKTGMKVQVAFEKAEDLFVPVFRPEGA
jgi:uncharacterized OB-fold protein